VLIKPARCQRLPLAVPSRGLGGILKCCAYVDEAGLQGVRRLFFNNPGVILLVCPPPPQSSAAGPYGAAREMDMPYRFSSTGVALCALALLTFTGQADATARLVLKASSNVENPEVQNLLDPQSDNGVPGGPSAATPVEPGQPGGQMNAAPQGGNESEQNEIDQEEGK
jgi:hypothetical protein